MPKFIQETLGMVNPADLLTTGYMVSRPNDPLETLFDNVQTNNLVATYHTMASQYNIPQMAQFHAFDVPAQKSIPAPIDEHNVEKGLIKVKRNTSELLRQLLDRGVTVESELYNYVMDHAADLSDQVVTRANVARAELLSRGEVTIKENGLDLTIDYGVPTENKGLEIDFGGDVAAQIQEIVDSAADAGVTITGIVTSRSCITKMRQNEGIQKAISGAAMVGALVPAESFRAWLLDEYGIGDVITDDMSYSLPYELDTVGRPQVTAHRYFPKNVITFYGTSNGMKFGSGLWGVPPEVDIARYYEGGVQGSRNPYVYVSQWAESDPAVLWTKASALYIPVLYNPYSLYIAKAVDGEGVNPSVTLSQKTMSLTEGNSKALTATTTPADATVTWTTSDESVATVVGGTVTAIGAGTATITATITVEGTDYTATCAVTVSE